MQFKFKRFYLRPVRTFGPSCTKTFTTDFTTHKVLQIITLRDNSVNVFITDQVGTPPRKHIFVIT